MKCFDDCFFGFLLVGGFDFCLTSISKLSLIWSLMICRKYLLAKVTSFDHTSNLNLQEKNLYQYFGRMKTDVADNKKRRYYLLVIVFFLSHFKIFTFWHVLRVETQFNKKDYTEISEKGEKGSTSHLFLPTIPQRTVPVWIPTCFQMFFIEKRDSGICHRNIAITMHFTCWSST